MGLQNILGVIAALLIGGIFAINHFMSSHETTTNVADYHQEVIAREIAQSGFNLAVNSFAQHADWDSLATAMVADTIAYSSGYFVVESAVHTPAPPAERVALAIKGHTGLKDHTVMFDVVRPEPPVPQEVSPVMPYCSAFTGRYGYVADGVGLADMTSGTLAGFNIPGSSVVAAHIFWASKGGAAGSTTDVVNFQVDSGAPVLVTGDRQMDGSIRGYAADVTALVQLGTHSYTLSNIYDAGYQEGFGIVVVYEDSGLSEGDIRYCLGADYGYFGQSAPVGIDPEIFMFDYGAESACEADRPFSFSLFVTDVNEPTRLNALWAETGSGPFSAPDTDGDGWPDIIWQGNAERLVPDPLVAPEATPPHPAQPYGACAPKGNGNGCVGPFPPQPYAFLSNRGSRLDVYEQTLTMPSSATWLALQVESIPSGNTAIAAGGYRGSSLAMMGAIGRMPSCPGPTAGDIQPRIENLSEWSQDALGY